MLSWIIIAMFLAQFFCLLLKQIINIDYTFLDEFNWLFLGAVLFSGYAYCVVQENQEIVSLFYKKLSNKQQLLLNLFSVFLLLLPLAFVIFGVSWNNVTIIGNDTGTPLENERSSYSTLLRGMRTYAYLLLIFLGSQLIALGGISQACKIFLKISHNKPSPLKEISRGK